MKKERDKSLSDVFKGRGQIVPPLGLEFDTAGGRQMLQCWNMHDKIKEIPENKEEPCKGAILITILITINKIKKLVS